METANGWMFASTVVQSVASLAWPIALVATVWILREDIRKLLPQLKLKHGETEIGFSQVSEIVEQVQIHEVQSLLKDGSRPRSSAIQTANLSDMKDDELRLAVEDCALKMRELEGSFRYRRVHLHTQDEKHWEEYTRELLEESDERRQKFQTTLQPKARALRDELLARLNGSVPQDDPMTDFIFDHGSLAGPDPLNQAALRLEQLARKLIGPTGGPRTIVP